MTFIYLELYFPDLNLEQLLFTLRMPLVGTSSELVFGVVVLILVIPIIFFLINYFFIKNNVIVTIILGKISRKVFPIHIKQCKIALSLLPWFLFHRLFIDLILLIKTHGDFNIKDSNYYRENGYVPKDYHVWWGIEDKKIIEYSKKELIKLGNAANPFMFSVFLEDTHSPSGYMDEDCEQKYSNQIHNMFSCTSKRVAGFVKWIKEQPFYHNTVIVLLGDHLYMGNDLYTQKKIPLWAACI